MKTGLTLVGIVTCMSLVIPAIVDGKPCSAAEPASDSASSLRDVQAAEAEGKAVNRELLPQISSANRWAAGQVKVGESWTKIHELDEQACVPSSYRKQRSASDNSEQSQLKLARWCKRQGMAEQATAHYFGVLFANANNLEARRELKHQWINDRWYTAKEIEAARVEAEKRLDNLEAWTPKLKGILRKLQSAQGAQKLAAIQALEQIEDPAAIVAMEAGIAAADEQLALPLVKAIGKFRSPDACQALMAIATGDPTSPISQAAIRELGDFPEALVIPDLLAAMSLPIDLTCNVVGLPNGRLALTTLVSRELNDRRYVQRVEKQLRVLSQVQSNVSITKQESKRTTNEFLRLNGNLEVNTRNTDSVVSTSGGVAAQYVPDSVAAAAQADLRDQAQDLEDRIAIENLRIHANNQRICSVLRELSSQTYGDDPVAWWTWWGDRNERKYEQSKPVIQRNYYDEQHLVVATENYTGLGTRQYTEETRPRSVEVKLTPRQAFLQQLWRTQLSMVSCLVAGTPVQTAEGLRPIDKIEIGDLVVAQDVETGELALKPVIQTTQGPPRSIVRIVTSSGKIQATPAHFWWVAGQGWKRSRELKSGMQLHTATGTLEVREVVDEADPQTTYNLVVDDSHTYFVGEERILSHDITSVQGTVRVVPGYEQFAAKR